MEVLIGAVVQAVFLQHAENLILFLQKAASGEEKKDKTIHLWTVLSFVQYFSLGEGEKGIFFFSPAAAFMNMS